MVTKDIDDTQLANAILGINEIDDAFTPMSRKRYREILYWRFCSIEGCNQHTNSGGWVTTGPSLNPLSAIEYVEFQAGKHATPLTEYKTVEPDEVSLPATRFKPLIERGGLKEMPLEQLQAYGWHHIPAIVEARPELADTIEFLCEHGCPREGMRKRWFLREETLHKHYRAIHADVVAPTVMATKIADAMEKLPEAIGGGVDTETLVTLVIAGIKAYEESKETKDKK